MNEENTNREESSSKNNDNSDGSNGIDKSNGTDKKNDKNREKNMKHGKMSNEDVNKKSKEILDGLGEDFSINEEIEKELNGIKKELDETKDMLLRERASFVNFRAQADRKLNTAKTSATENLLEKFFSALDDIDRTKENADLPQEVLTIFNKLQSVFESVGVESFGEVGDEFDPNLHEALMHKVEDSVEDDKTADADNEEADADGEEQGASSDKGESDKDRSPRENKENKKGEIIERELIDTVVTRGYKVNGRVVRPAKVCVVTKKFYK